MRLLLIILLLPVFAFSQLSKPTHFKFKDSTGVNATIAITAAANPNVDVAALELGDEIGVFNTKDTCCGAIVWETINTAIIAQGDNSMTSAIDGFYDGELMSFKIWKKKSKKEYKAKVAYSAVSPFKTGFFYTNGIYLLTELTGTTQVGISENTIPSKISVKQNYPNPFNPSTKINVEIPNRSNVSINIFDVNGKKIKNLFNSSLAAGSHVFEWNAKDDNGILMASGVYYYKILINENFFVGKMLLSK